MIDRSSPPLKASRLIDVALVDRDVKPENVILGGYRTPPAESLHEQLDRLELSLVETRRRFSSAAFVGSLLGYFAGRGVVELIEWVFR
jgi:hypothetical protein